MRVAIVVRLPRVLLGCPCRVFHVQGGQQLPILGSEPAGGQVETQARGLRGRDELLGEETRHDPGGDEFVWGWGC